MNEIINNPTVQLIYPNILTNMNNEEKMKKK